MIKEQEIDLIASKLESADFEGELKLFSHNYQLLHAYLLSDQFELLSEEEYKILWFDAMVIVRSYELSQDVRSKIDEKRLEDLESANWAKFDNAKPSGFREKLDVFFENTQQEDLLAFVEDSLADDDDEFKISSAAKEIIFVCLASIIELLN